MIPPNPIGRRARPVIWLADDSPSESELAQRALDAYFEVRLFRDGEGLVEAIAHVEWLPDAVILDWVMPGMSGIEVCQYLRSNPLTRRIPALLLTSHDRAEDVVEALEAGANDFVVKPFQSGELLARLRALLRTDELVARAERAEAASRALLEGVPDALITFGAEQHVLYVNAEAARILGASAENLTGRKLSELLPGIQTEGIPDVALETFPIPDIKLKDRTYAAVVRPLMMIEGLATAISLRDVTLHRQKEARRLDFYSVIAHELRSPLTAVSLRVGLILRGKGGELSAEHRAGLEQVSQRLTMLDELITDFLELARMDASGLQLKLVPLNLAEMVKDVASEFDLLAESAAISLKIDVQTGSEPDVLADSRRLRQVVLNLLSNAIKFTPTGGSVIVFVRPRDDSVEVRVTDTGIGLTAESRTSLFHRYVRAGEEAQRIAGTGLGLMIVREIVDAHHGQVDVESEPGKGSSFWFRLPRLDPATVQPMHVVR